MLCSNGSTQLFFAHVTPTLFVPSCQLSQSGSHLRRPMNRPAFHLSAYGYGWTEDGDFEEEEAVGGANEKDTSNTAKFNTGTSIGSQGVGNMLFNEDLMRSGRVDLGVGSANRYRDFRGNEVVPKVDPTVKEWLLEIMPDLDDNDLGIYAEGLTNIGYHAQCASMFELQYEDLDFMKVLHRRYLYKEITGQELRPPF